MKVEWGNRTWHDRAGRLSENSKDIRLQKKVLNTPIYEVRPKGEIQLFA